MVKACMALEEPEVKVANGRATVTSGQTYCNEVYSQWIHVTPELAEGWLGKNSAQNRNRSIPTVDRYSWDMARGNWPVTHQGIAFGADGSLVDGQHRLAAIAKARVTVPLLVTFNVPGNAIEQIDRGKVRTIAQALQVLGYGPMSSCYAVATVRSMMRGPLATNSKMTPTTSDVREFVAEHCEAITFAIGFGKQVGPAPIRALLGRAYYTVPMRHLSRFALAVQDQIDSGDVSPGDKTARHLGKLIMANANTRGGNAMTELYRKAQAALRAYLDGKDQTRLCGTTDDLFPLPSKEEV